MTQTQPTTTEPSRGGDRTNSYQRLWCIDNLPMPRVFMTGPKWRRCFGVERRALTDVNPPWAPLVKETRRWVLTFTFEEDVRELVLEEIRPGVVAEWSDPRERFR